MATIRDYARSNIPATYPELERKYPGDAGLVNTTVNRLTTEVLNPGVSEEDLTEASRAHLGDIVTVRLILPAIDMYMVESRLSDGLNSESVAYYDRIEALTKLKGILEKRIDKNQAIFDQINDGDVVESSQVVASPRVSSTGTSFITMSPNEFSPINDV